jgi:hypothetical protein
MYTRAEEAKARLNAVRALANATTLGVDGSQVPCLLLPARWLLAETVEGSRNSVCVDNNEGAAYTAAPSLFYRQCCQW